jgi:hypothetical protein
MREDSSEHSGIEYTGAMAGDRQVLAFKTTTDLQGKRGGPGKGNLTKAMYLPESVHFFYYVFYGPGSHPGSKGPANLFTGPLQYRIDVYTQDHSLRPEDQHTVAEERNNVIIDERLFSPGTVLIRVRDRDVPV